MATSPPPDKRSAIGLSRMMSPPGFGAITAIAVAASMREPPDPEPGHAVCTSFSLAPQQKAIVGTEAVGPLAPGRPDQGLLRRDSCARTTKGPS